LPSLDQMVDSQSADSHNDHIRRRTQKSFR
jgi:hypothetical protein